MTQALHSYRRTLISCFTGIFVQAIITNVTAILFIPMMTLYGLSYAHLGILVGVNFTSQVAADILFSRALDKKGFRFFVLPTCICAAVGLVLLAAAPLLFENVFIGVLLATVIFSFSSGLLEVLLSPIIDALPGTDKGPAMSLMHSFYAWGQVATIILTTLFVYFVGGEHWQWIVLIWTIVPLTCFFLFLKAPFPPSKPAEQRQGMRQLLFRPFYLVALAAIFFGAATEVTMNQWASPFMEKGLELPKLAGDLLGMCGFAVMLGIGRVLYGIYGSRMNLHRVLTLSAVMAAICYLTVAICPYRVPVVVACALCGIASSLLWPGTLVVTSARYPMAGAWLFAILAAAGDIGAAFGGWLTGIAADAAAGSSLATWFEQQLHIAPEQSAMRIGLLVCVLFPVLTAVCHVVLHHMRRKKAVEE